MMSLFFTLGSTVHDWGWPKNGPFWTKSGQTWQACQRSGVVQKGPKGTKMANWSVFYHLEPFWARLDPFGPFQTKMFFFAPNGQSRVWRRCFGAKNHFLFKMVQKAPDGPKRNTSDYDVLTDGYRWLRLVRGGFGWLWGGNRWLRVVYW